MQNLRVLIPPPHLSPPNYFGAHSPLLKELSLFEISYLSRPWLTKLLVSWWNCTSQDFLMLTTVFSLVFVVVVCSFHLMVIVFKPHLSLSLSDRVICAVVAYQCWVLWALGRQLSPALASQQSLLFLQTLTHSQTQSALHTSGKMKELKSNRSLGKGVFMFVCVCGQPAEVIKTSHTVKLLV